MARETSSIVWCRLKLSILQCDLPRLDLGKVQDVVDEGQQSPPAVLSHVCEAPLLRRKVCVHKELKHAQDAIHGGADFVAHVGQETALRPIGGIRGFPGVNQFLLVAFLLGDLLRNSDDSNQLSGLVANRKSPVSDPFLLPVRCSYAVFRFDRFSLYLPRKQSSGPVPRSSGWIASAQDIGFW